MPSSEVFHSERTPFIFEKTGTTSPAETDVCFPQILFNGNLNNKVAKCRNYGNLPSCRNSFRFVPKLVLA